MAIPGTRHILQPLAIVPLMGMYFALAYMFDRRFSDDNGTLWLALWAVCTLTAGFVAWRLYRLRRTIDGLTPVDELSRTFGIQPDEIVGLAAEHGAKPQYNINGVDYYDARDLGELSLLLHPSSQPVESTLLHPALGRQNEVVQTELLRMADSSDNR